MTSLIKAMNVFGKDRQIVCYGMDIGKIYCLEELFKNHVSRNYALNLFDFIERNGRLVLIKDLKVEDDFIRQCFGDSTKGETDYELIILNQVGRMGDKFHKYSWIDNVQCDNSFDRAKLIFKNIYNWEREILKKSGRYYLN